MLCVASRGKNKENQNQNREKYYKGN